ncbi:MAG: hypothetical protein II338_03915 [Bacteroidaceae bacterium]|nr:hypothetical protein [Bacteroidaceae bacterium]
MAKGHAEKETVVEMKFIVVHILDKEIMLNTDWIEMITELEDGSCIIYLSFSDPNADQPDFVIPEESYQDVKHMIWR